MTMSHQRLAELFVLGGLVMLLAGCSTQQLANERAGIDVPAATGNTPSGNQQKDQGKLTGTQDERYVDVLPLSNYADPLSFSSAQGADFSGMYTRLLMRAVKVSSQTVISETSLEYKGRNKIKRLLSGKQHSMVLSAKLKVNGLEQTVPIVALSHESSSDGESWSREVLMTGSHFPLFLTKSGGGSSSPTLEITLRGDNEYTVKGAGRSIRALTAIAGFAGIQSSVVTKLTEQGTKDKAERLDQVLSSLLGSSIAERRLTDVDLRLWRADSNGPVGVKVELMLPQEEGNWDGKRDSAGSWEIAFDYPRPSVFVESYVCGAFVPRPHPNPGGAPLGAWADYFGRGSAGSPRLGRCYTTAADARNAASAQKDASEILGFQLSQEAEGGGTIRAFISRQTWYTPLVERLANAATQLEAADNFCRETKNAIAAINLSGFDANLVTWAVLRGLPLKWPSNVETAAPSCKAAVDAVTPAAPVAPAVAAVPVVPPAPAAAAEKPAN
ncbi:hypothetical protein [Piscinibacter sp. HJYY11]|uniref:hypothetical protein n=1 Tax=Piscinibacter sp. HJYY11 TaxID=2801333 RepID=UPI00191E122D|nr:hypothetical protein [Piscinibacter sp. HJYY11]MBL0727160.1 hypothetical protein [Piscinibacter sp. HJYY11]